MKYAGVIVDIANENVDKLFTYELNIDAVIGQRVLVPFGRGNTPIEGIILELYDNKPDSKYELKQIIRTCEDYPVLDEGQITLAKQLRSSLHCTLAQALRLMLPAQMRGMRVSEKKVRTVRINDGIDTEAVISGMTAKNGKSKSPKKAEILRLLSELDGEMSVADLNEFVPNCSPAVRSMIDSGILVENYRTVYRRPLKIESKSVFIPTPTHEQAAAYDKIAESLDNKSFETFLLRGVTGSGKTEVYIRAIEHCLSLGRGAIMLVPEISLTPQTVQRFTERFGDKIAVLHSKLSIGERFDEWRRLRLGMATVAVGARSAVFAPVKDLGIIIIDEEHEGSYYADNTPRYNAISTARMRCRYNNAVLVLGSATPSVTSYFHTQTERYKLLELNSRINNNPLPKVDVIDMRAEFMSGNTSIFSGELASRLDNCIKNGEQAILFLNRRGYSSFLECRACGYVFKCNDCDISMTYYKSDMLLKCHYCGNTKPVPKVCPECGRPHLKYVGTGTQQVEEEFKRLFPDTNYIRMDSDTTSAKDSHTKLLKAFADGEAQVLIGTQMIAKGLDFPNVTLVGVIDADTMLNMPDFRNTERAFQLLTQVSGRAGRADKEGNVIIQTSAPDHPIIAFACEQDYVKFYDYVIKQRLESLYPPYSSFLRVLFVGDDDDKLSEEAIAFSDGLYEKFGEVLTESGSSYAEVLFMYAMPAPIKRIKGQYRRHVLIKLAMTKNITRLIGETYLFAKSGEFPHLYSVEINPSEML